MTEPANRLLGSPEGRFESEGSHGGAGLLALVGGGEFQPGNEPADEVLAASARARGPAYVIATAAARSHPEAAVRHAATWYQKFDLDVTELRVYTRSQAGVPATAAAAAEAAFFYIAGGDPGLVASVLRETPVGDAIIAAWRRGAVLAGSSAGAMALCEHVLVRQKFPGNVERRPVPGLSVLPHSAVLPHHNTFGSRWFPSARAALPAVVLIGVDERTCALWEAGVWRCLGSGGVTVYRDGESSARYRSGVVDGIPAPSCE
jgi:cyanophycinase